jgi:hypothetical protein
MSYEYPKARWWWTALQDWMIANPGKSLKLATTAHGGPVDVTYATLMNVVHSDLFKAELAQRKATVSLATDIAVVQKTTEIAVLGLDLIHGVMKEKRQSIPLEDLQSITGSALDRLGYGAQKPGAGTSVNVNVTQQSASVDPTAFREAQERLQGREKELAALPPPVSEKVTIIENTGDVTHPLPWEEELDEPNSPAAVSAR